MCDFSCCNVSFTNLGPFKFGEDCRISSDEYLVAISFGLKFILSDIKNDRLAS